MIRVRLLKRNRIDGNAGDIVTVSPARAAFLIAYGLGEAAPIREQIETPEGNTEPETPEDTVEPETPEKKTGKSTAKKGAKK